MDFETARREFESGKLKEIVIEPAGEGDGWMILVEREKGEIVKIMDHSGVEKIYHTLDRATHVAKQIGFETVRIEERF